MKEKMSELYTMAKFNDILSQFKSGKQVPFEQLCQMSDITISQVLMAINKCEFDRTQYCSSRYLKMDEHDRIQINRLRNKLRLKAVVKGKYLQFDVENILVNAILKNNFGTQILQQKIEKAIDMCRDFPKESFELKDYEIIRLFDYIDRTIKNGEIVSIESLQKICDISMTKLLTVLNSKYTRTYLNRIRNDLRLKAISKGKSLPSYIENVIIKSILDKNINIEEIDRIIDSCNELKHSSQFHDEQDGEEGR